MVETLKYIQFVVAFANKESYIECNRYETVFKTVNETPLAYAAAAD
jgi:hypothetical protein